MFFPGGRIVGNVFDNHLDRLDLGACPVVEEEGRQETHQRQPGEHRHGVRRQGVGAGQNGVHSKKSSRVSGCFQTTFTTSKTAFGKLFINMCPGGPEQVSSFTESGSNLEDDCTNDDDGTGEDFL